MLASAYADFLAHAKAEAPREACGWLVDTGQTTVYVRSRNTAVNPFEHFTTHKLDYLDATARGKIVAVCHSHPEGTPPSPADRTACERSKLPWYVLTLPHETLSKIEPAGFRAPLLGRNFVHGIHDCYALGRDYYIEKEIVELPDYPREDGWWDRGQNLYLDHFAENGFRVVQDLQKHDALLMQCRTPVPAHLGIYIGDNFFLHHAIGQLSCRAVYGGYWRNVTTHILRYDAVMR